jgi:hypothetical protein
LILCGVTARYYYKSQKYYYLVARLYDVVEYTMLALFFSVNITNRSVKKVTQFSIIPFAAFCLYDFLTAKTPIYAFLPLAVECLALLLVIIFIFFEKLQYNLDIPIYQTSLFWIIAAFIIFFSGNFCLFLYSNNFYGGKNFSTDYYTIIYGFVTMIKILLICIGVSTKDRPQVNDYKISDPEFDHLIFPNQQK